MRALSRSVRGGPLASAAVMLAAVALAACTTDDERVQPVTGCDGSVAAAAAAIEPDDQVALLDQALRSCSGADTFTAALQAHPGLVGFDAATFLARRCNVGGDAVRTAPACLATLGPTTTVPDRVTDVVFVGATLDGRSISLRPDAETDFVGDLPAVVQQTLDIAVESGCAGVIQQRDAWVVRSLEPAIADEASVYARHAQEVADYLNCEAPPITAPVTVPASTAPAG